MLDLEDWADNGPRGQVRVAMVRYSFLMQAYVWGESEAPIEDLREQSNLRECAVASGDAALNQQAGDRR